MDSYTSNDTIVCTDYRGKWVLNDFAAGAVADLTAPNDISSTTTGYNGNSLGAHNEPGRQRECSLRIVKGSDDDKRLNQNYNLWKNRSSLFRPLKMFFTKNVAHEDGSLTKDTVDCFFGLPAGPPAQTMNTEGDTEQVISVYMLRFGNSERSM